MPDAGVLLVFSKPKDHWAEDQFNDWYSNYHIQDVVESPLSDLAIRYKNTNPNAKWPYLCVYRMPDVATIADQNVVASIPAKHDLIPEGQTWHEAIHAEMRTYALLQKFEGQIPKEGPRGKALRTVFVEPADEAEFDEWYRKQHLDMLSMVPGFRRSTRYKLTDEENKEGHPRFVALHEYDTKDFPVEKVKLVTGTEWSKKILGEAKSFQGDVLEEIAATGAVDSKL